MATDHDYLIALDTTQSEIIIRIQDSSTGRIVGTLDVESEKLNAFDAAARQMLEWCASLLQAFWSNHANSH